MSTVTSGSDLRRNDVEGGPVIAPSMTSHEGTYSPKSPLTIEETGVEQQVLFRDEFCLAYRRGTVRVDPDNYRFNRLDSDSVLLLEDGHCLRDHALAACKIRNTEKIRRFGASSLLTLIEMVDADLGITFLPEMARGSTLLRNTRVGLQALSDKSYRNIGIAWRKGSRRSDEFRLLGDFITDNR